MPGERVVTPHGQEGIVIGDGGALALPLKPLAQQGKQTVGHEVFAGIGGVLGNQQPGVVIIGIQRHRGHHPSIGRRIIAPYARQQALPEKIFGPLLGDFPPQPRPSHLSPR